MEQYAYLSMTLIFCALCTLSYLRRPDLRPRIARVLFPGAIAGAVAEYWYFSDYWQPPSLFGRGVICPEDFLVGAAITGLGVSIYPFIGKKRVIPFGTNERRAFFLLFLACALLLIILSSIFTLPSILSTEGIFLLATAFILWRRMDLLPASLGTGFLLGLMMIPIYLFSFTWLAPGYWDRHWLLAGSRLGIILLPDVPLTEFLWFVTFGMFAGIAPHFRNGTALVSAPPSP